MAHSADYGVVRDNYDLYVVSTGNHPFRVVPRETGVRELDSKTILNQKQLQNHSCKVFLIYKASLSHYLASSLG